MNLPISKLWCVLTRVYQCVQICPVMWNSPVNKQEMSCIGHITTTSSSLMCEWTITGSYTGSTPHINLHISSFTNLLVELMHATDTNQVLSNQLMWMKLTLKCTCSIFSALEIEFVSAWNRWWELSAEIFNLLHWQGAKINDKAHHAVGRGLKSLICPTTGLSLKSCSTPADYPWHTCVPRHSMSLCH